MNTYDSRQICRVKMMPIIVAALLSLTLWAIGTAPVQGAHLGNGPIPSAAALQEIDVTGATHVEGFQYLVAYDFGAPADSSDNNVISTLRIFEDGVELFPAHTNHSVLSDHGNGRFSHWGNTTGTYQALRFSASDNSDPRSNGRTYEYYVDEPYVPETVVAGAVSQCTTLDSSTGNQVPIPTDALDIPSTGLECPFAERSNSVVVNFGNEVIYNVNSTSYIDVDTTILAGSYAVELFGWDSYEYRNSLTTRVTVPAQTETYDVTFYDGSTEIARSDLSQNLQDFIDPAHWQGTVNDNLTIAQDVDRVRAGNSPGSIIVGCMRLTTVDATCSDGVTGTGEDCSLVNQCGTSTCGDGFYTPYDLGTGEPAEECDDGNSIDNDACSNTCRRNNVCPDIDGDGACDACTQTGPDGQCLECPDINQDGVCDAIEPCVPGSTDPSCNACTDVNGNGVCEPECLDADNDGQCDLTPICGVADQGAYIGGAPPSDAELCNHGTTPINVGSTSDDTQWIWMCENSVTGVSDQCSATKGCGAGEYQCNGVCATLQISGSNSENVPRDSPIGTTNQSITSSDQSCLQSCTLEGQNVTINGPAVGLTTDHSPGIVTIQGQCTYNPASCDPLTQDCSPIDLTKSISSNCVVKKCSTSGQCVSKSIGGQTSGTGSACANECQTNADCSGGGYIEVSS